MIDVGDVVYFIRGQRALGPAIVDNADELTGKRWVNTIEDEGCYLVDENKLFKTRDEALASIGRKLKKYEKKIKHKVHSRITGTRRLHD